MRRLLLCLSFLAGTACAPDPHKAIVGRWAARDRADIVWSFAEDGSISMANDNSPVAGGTYSFTDAHHVNVVMKGPFGIEQPFTWRIDFEHDALILSAARDSLRFDRLK